MHLNDERVALKYHDIPSSGSKYIVKGLGLPYHNSFGDLIIVFKITMPNHIQQSVLQ